MTADWREELLTGVRDRQVLSQPNSPVSTESVRTLNRLLTASVHQSGPVREAQRRFQQVHGCFFADMDAPHHPSAQDQDQDRLGPSPPSLDRSASFHVPGSSESPTLSALQRAPEGSEGSEGGDLEVNTDADSASTWSPEVLALVRRGAGGWRGTTGAISSDRFCPHKPSRRAPLRPQPLHHYLHRSDPAKIQTNVQTSSFQRHAPHPTHVE